MASPKDVSSSLGMLPSLGKSNSDDPINASARRGYVQYVSMREEALAELEWVVRTAPVPRDSNVDVVK